MTGEAVTEIHDPFPLPSGWRLSQPVVVGRSGCVLAKYEHRELDDLVVSVSFDAKEGSASGLHVVRAIDGTERVACHSKLQPLAALHTARSAMEALTERRQRRVLT